MLRRLLLPFLLIGVVIMTWLTFFYVAEFSLAPTADELDHISLYEHVEGKLMQGGSPDYLKSFMSYANIYYNISTPSGWYPQGARAELIQTIDFDFRVRLMSGDCEGMAEIMDEYDIRSVIGINLSCEKIEECGLREVARKGNSCLFFYE
jgi:hypothetical protein